VLVPGINDGEVLEDSLARLAPFFPHLASLSVVPVGLTEHRRDLPQLRLMTSQEARETMSIIRLRQEEMMRKHGSRWVFPADELILRAGEEIPEDEDYEDYPQIENGVGMLRTLINSAQVFLEQSPLSLEEERKIVWTTGVSAYPTLERLANEFVRRFSGLDIEVLAVKNRLLGESVTVAGLLGGKDIHRTLQEWFDRRPEKRRVDAVFLPPDCVNNDGLMLDDWTPQEISRRIQRPVRLFSGDWKVMLSRGTMR
jgi:NifB/MoaA-like Fe-S oxidoreductase